jgi:Spy/CpxP family protein refolding chaperone
VKSPSRATLVIIVCTLIAAAVGGWIGVRYGMRDVTAEQQLDQLLHRKLGLSAVQQHQIAELETAFAARRSALEGQMRAANRDLAAAIAVRHHYDQAAKEAIGRLHGAMMDLQEASIEHVLAMRAVLTPVQTQQFDRTISEALTDGAP